MNADFHIRDHSHYELVQARNAIRSRSPLRRIRRACDYLKRNGDWIDQKQAEMVLAAIPAPINRTNVAVWGAAGAFLALFWIFAGIPAIARIIQIGGQFVRGLL